MEIGNVAFTLVDTQIMDSYKAMLAGLSAYLGSGYEIVLHSLEDLDHSVVAIFNGERTGRQVGAPITDLALQMLAQIEENHMQDCITYFNHTGNKEAFRSATIIIRGERGRIIGLLCINYDLYQPLHDFIEGLHTGMEEPVQNTRRPVEVLANQSDDLIVSMLNEVRADVCADKSIPASNRNKEIVWRLQEKGVFKLKNSVVRISELLDISRNTVYMHLRSAEKHKEMQ